MALEIVCFLAIMELIHNECGNEVEQVLRHLLRIFLATRTGRLAGRQWRKWRLSLAGRLMAGERALEKGEDFCLQVCPSHYGQRTGQLCRVAPADGESQVVRWVCVEAP